jgi:hypothetical protein
MQGNPAKIVPKARRCCTGKCGLAFFDIDLQQPLHCLIPDRALVVEDGIRLKLVSEV